MTTIKFTEHQILIKLKANYDADKIKTPNYDFFQALSDVSDLKDPKTLAEEFNSTVASTIMLNSSQTWHFTPQELANQSSSRASNPIQALESTNCLRV